MSRYGHGDVKWRAILAHQGEVARERPCPESSPASPKKPAERSSRPSTSHTWCPGPSRETHNSSLSDPRPPLWPVLPDPRLALFTRTGFWHRSWGVVAEVTVSFDCREESRARGPSAFTHSGPPPARHCPLDVVGLRQGTALEFLIDARDQSAQVPFGSGRKVQHRPLQVITGIFYL